MLYVSVSSRHIFPMYMYIVYISDKENKFLPSSFLRVSCIDFTHRLAAKMTFEVEGVLSNGCQVHKSIFHSLLFRY